MTDEDSRTRRAIVPSPKGSFVIGSSELVERGLELAARIEGHPKTILTFISSLEEIARDLAPSERRRFNEAGPIIAILTIEASLRATPSPPARLPVAARLSSLSFAVWRDIEPYLGSFRSEVERVHGRQVYAAFRTKTAALASNPWTLLALTVPLYAQAQMENFSIPRTTPHYDSPGEIMALLAPIVEYRAEPLVWQAATTLADTPPNATFVVLLIAGRVPFAITCLTDATLRVRADLEAATVLLIPQIVLSARAALPQSERQLMDSALQEQLRRWATCRPTIFDQSSPPWLPRLA